jgi:MATE family multidrug resistance protein
VLFLGHLPDPEALGAGTLSTMYLNITGNTVGMGLATAMDTLCSQAYGAGDKKQACTAWNLRSDRNLLLYIYVVKR